VKKQINIFIISPSDVNSEREIARDVCSQLNEVIGSDVEVNSVLWEYKPQNYHKDPQGNFNAYKQPFGKFDIAIVILWERLGSFIPKEYVGKITGKSPVTGTQWEIEEVMAQCEMPLFFYFKTEKKLYGKDELQEGLQQKKLLETFLEDIDLQRGGTGRGYQEFDSADKFRDMLKSHLETEIEMSSGIRISASWRSSLKPKSKMVLIGTVVIFLTAVLFLWILMGGSTLKRLEPTIEVPKFKKKLTVKINETDSHSNKPIYALKIEKNMTKKESGLTDLCSVPVNTSAY